MDMVIDVEKDPKDGTYKAQSVRPSRESTIEGIKALILWVAALFYLFGLNNVDRGEVGIAYNHLTGNAWTQTEGWHITNPFVFVGYMSTEPMIVTIPSDSDIVVSKLVRFKREGVKDFVLHQGNCWVFCDQHDVLLGWAFSGERVPFLEIIEPKLE